MACPKRRKSKSKQKMRRGAKRWSPIQLQNCSSCGTAKPSHIVCPSCGYYGDRQVETIEAAA